MTTTRSRIAVSCALLFGVVVACGDRSGLPIVCRETAEKVVPKVPNLYFVLDRSRSMQENLELMLLPPGQPGSKWDIVRTDIAALIVSLGDKAAFGTAMFPPPIPHPTIAEQCKAGTEVMSLRPGDGLPIGATGSTAGAFWSATSPLPYGGTPTAGTFQMLMQNLPAVPGHTFAVLATDGGPNCDTGLTCSVATCTCNIDRCNQLDCGGSTQPCCVPGGANCCGPPFNYTFDCLDSSNTVAAVAALAHAGVRTFAIGVPGSEAYADVLDDVAKAGQTARGTEPYYYPVSSSAAFVAALTDIAARISACTLELKAPPPDSTQVNVVIQKTQVPQTGSDGWTLDGNIVNLLGQTCDDAVAGEDVLVTFGCPTVY